MPSRLQEGVAPVVALDIGGVCLSLRHDEVARELGHESFRDLLRNHPESLADALAHEMGRIDTDLFVERMAQRLQLARDEFLRWWNSMLGTEISGMAELVRDLRTAGFRPAFFSNVGNLHFPALLPMLSFSNLVERGILSYEIGVMKPEPEAYEAFETQICGGGTPALYLDDREENIEGARSRGWNTHLFHDADDAGKRIAALQT